MVVPRALHVVRRRFCRQVARAAWTFRAYGGAASAAAYPSVRADAGQAAAAPSPKASLPESHEINMRISECRTHAALYSLLLQLRKDGVPMTGVNVATALFMMARKPPTELLEMHRWLLDVLRKRVTDLTVRELPNVLWALPRLTRNRKDAFDKALLADLAAHCSNHLRSLADPAFNSIILGFAHLGERSEVFWTSAAREIALRSLLAPPQSLANMFWCLGAVAPLSEAVQKEALPGLTSRLLAIAEDLNGTDVGSCMWAAGQILLSHRPLVAALIERAMDLRNDLDDRAIVRVVTAAERLNVLFHDPIYGVLAKVAAARVPKMSWANMIELGTVISPVPYCHEWHNAFLARLQTDLRYLKPHDFVAAVAFLAESTRPPGLLDQIVWHAMTHMDSFDPLQVASLVASMNTMSYADSKFYNKAAKHLNEKDAWRTLPIKDLAETAVALVKRHASNINIRSNVCKALYESTDKIANLHDLVIVMHGLNAFGLSRDDDVIVSIVRRVQDLTMSVDDYPVDIMFFIQEVARIRFGDDGDQEKKKIMALMADSVLRILPSLSGADVAMVAASYCTASIVDLKLFAEIHRKLSVVGALDFQLDDEIGTLLYTMGDLGQLKMNEVAVLTPERLMKMDPEVLSAVTLFGLEATMSPLSKPYPTSILDVIAKRLTAMHDGSESTDDVADDTRWRFCHAAIIWRYLVDHHPMPESVDKLTKRWLSQLVPLSQRPEPSKFAQQVSRELNRLGHVNSLEQWIPELCVHADLVITGTRVVVEVDGPHHYYSVVGSSKPRLRMSTIARHKLLRAAGYRVLVVPHSKWVELGNADARRQWLGAALKALPRHDSSSTSGE
ncbi:RAP domain-containing protein [Plasmodiophora brassicae]|uniref:RAP domain-containing protein n=1 Tax=Plasmodiophora brassicae TaxID=37360 RepID=A0A0G4IQJ3_PLABS|nr:hypothetical protein PBRA_000785 [Plasmodiophora brassicae]SPQ97751.1 unnamed protein product [Plasmodiophora brassicae]